MGSLLNKLKEHTMEAIVLVVWLGVVIPTYNHLEEWMREPMSLPTARKLLLLFGILFAMALLFVGKVIKEKKSYLKFDKNLYWKPNDPNPFCPICYDSDKKEVRLHPAKLLQRDEKCYLCHTCNHQYVEGKDENFSVNKIKL